MLKKKVLRNLQLFLLLTFSLMVLLNYSKISPAVPLNTLEQADELFFFVSDLYRPQAKLVDSTGTALHEWKSSRDIDRWCYALPVANGNLLVVERDKAIRLLDKDSQVLWEHKGGFHHHVLYHPEKGVYVFERKPYEVAVGTEKLHVLGEFLWQFSIDGRVLNTWNLTDLLLKYLPGEMLKRAKNYLYGEPIFKIDPNSPADVFHVNSHAFVSLPLESHLADAFMAVSISKLNSIAYFNTDFTEVIQMDKVTDEYLHGVTSNRFGSVSYYENGRNRLYSEAFDYDPVSQKINWRCDTIGGKRFFTTDRGSVERVLEKGWLVTVSRQGSAAIIDAECNAKWLFRNIDVETGALIPIYRVHMLQPKPNWL
jgi:hypothetical protein